MYRGEVNLLGEELNLFLSFGKDLKIKGKPTFLICFLSTGVVQLLKIINKLFLEYIKNAKQKIIFKNECKKLRKAVELKTVVLQIAIVCWFDCNWASSLLWNGQDKFSLKHHFFSGLIENNTTDRTSPEESQASSSVMNFDKVEEHSRIPPLMSAKCFEFVAPLSPSTSIWSPREDPLLMTGTKSESADLALEGNFMAIDQIGMDTDDLNRDPPAPVRNISHF